MQTIPVQHVTDQDGIGKVMITRTETVISGLSHTVDPTHWRAYTDAKVARLTLERAVKTAVKTAKEKEQAAKDKLCLPTWETLGLPDPSLIPSMELSKEQVSAQYGRTVALVYPSGVAIAKQSTYFFPPCQIDGRWEQRVS